MSIISDMEIIKSAVIYGDLDDAMSVIRRRKKSLAYRLKHHPSVKVLEYSRFIDSLEDLLRGKIELEEFRSVVESLENLTGFIDLSGDTEIMLESLYYLLEYSIDRYNIRFPAFDGKRCDDK